MKQILYFIIFFLFVVKLNSQCAYPNQRVFLESENLKTTFSNSGVLWGPMDTNSNSFTGIEYPKLTKTQIQQGEIGKFCMFSGNFFMSSITNGRLTASFTEIPNSSNAKLFSPGPIDLKTGQTTTLSSNTFNKIWVISNEDIINFQNQILNNTLPLNPNSITKDILTWPAKGNAYYASTSPILDNLAPFMDYNKNGIYDPQNGDFPKIKGNTSYFAVMNDKCVENGNGVELHLLGYVINGELTKNTIFYDLEITKKTPNDANEFIFGLLVDPDLGNVNDDYVGCDSLNNMGFCYNGNSFDLDWGPYKGYGNNIPVPTCRFLNKKMGSFITPTDTNRRYFMFSTINDIRNFMTAFNRSGRPYYWGLNGTTGSNITKYLFTGDPSKNNEWSMYSSSIPKFDYKFLMNTESTNLIYNTPQLYSFKVSIFPSSSWPPKMKDSIIPEDNKIVKIYDSLDICILSINKAIITPDITSQGTGSIELTLNSKNTPVSKWSSGEKNTTKITNKKAGVYNFKIFDGNCFIDTSFTITTKSTGGIASSLTNGFKVYPIPAKNELNIDFNRSQLINSITIQNIEGQVIRVEPIKSAITNYTLSIQDLPKGIYFLQVDGQDISQVSKFTKE